MFNYSKYLQVKSSTKAGPGLETPSHITGLERLGLPAHVSRSFPSKKNRVLR